MPSTTYCRVVRIIRTDGVVIGTTTSDRNLTIEDLTYKSTGAVDSVAIKKDVKLSTDNVEIRSVLDNDQVTSQDILNDRYRDAKIALVKIDYLNPPPTLLEGEVLLSGRVGKIELTDSVYVMEIRGLTAILNQGISVKASPICRWTFGDDDCGINLTTLTYSGQVSAVGSNKQITTDLNPTFPLDYGYIEFLSGINQGLIYSVKQNTGGIIDLISSLQFPPRLGDQIRAVAGCKRDQWTCRDVYSNFVKAFGGETSKWNEDSGYFPGTDKLISPDRD